MNKEPYIIIFDMDGTLLNNRKSISFLTRRYLKKLSKEGHKIVLASGRPYRAMNRYYEQLNLSTPIVCYNGAHLFSPKDNNFPSVEFEFPKEVIVSIIDKIKPYIFNVMCEDETNIWVDKKDSYLANFFWYESMDIHYGDLKDILDKNPMTCIVQTPYEFRDSKTIEEVMKDYPKLGARFWTGSPYFELYYLEISKGSALKRIAKYYNIPKERIIAFGDSSNDIEMFKNAGISVAMKNGKSCIKDVSTMLSIKDNNHNGVYHTLKKIFKN